MVLTWKCDVCGKVRVDKLISVHQMDIGKYRGLPIGVMGLNTKYCNDSNCKYKVHEVALKIAKSVEKDNSGI